MATYRAVVKVARYEVWLLEADSEAQVREGGIDPDYTESASDVGDEDVEFLDVDEYQA